MPADERWQPCDLCGEPFSWHRDADETVCKTCGYNLPHHETRCPERGLSAIEIRAEIANMSDAMSTEVCVRCGRTIGGAGAVIVDDALAHAYDCERIS